MPFGKITRKMDRTFNRQPRKSKGRKQRYNKSLSLINRQSAPEFKTLEYSKTAQTTSTTPVITCLNAISLGTDYDERVGRKLQMKSIQLRMVNTATPTTGVNQLHRVMLVYDKDPDGAMAAITDILTSSGITTNRNLTNRDRFVILIDKVISMQQSTVGQNLRFNKIYKRMNTPVLFNQGNDGTISDIQSGALLLVVIGSQAPGTGAGTIDYESRIRFTDD